MRRWSRKDGTAVLWMEHADGRAEVRLFRPDTSTLILKEYGPWERWEARETAEELAGLLDCEEEHARPGAA